MSPSTRSASLDLDGRQPASPGRGWPAGVESLHPRRQHGPQTWNRHTRPFLLLEAGHGLGGAEGFDMVVISPGLAKPIRTLAQVLGITGLAKVEPLKIQGA